MDRRRGDEHGWVNWARISRAMARRTETPSDSDDVRAAVLRARAEHTTVKMVGTGHSFTAIGAPDHTLLRPDALTGVIQVDRPAMTVTALAGTPLHALNATLTSMGLSLHNMGDIAEQTLAGAVSTGTHGSGGRVAGLAGQLAGFELVTGTGELLNVDEQRHPDVFSLGRVGLGALGVLTTVTLRVEPLFVLEADERSVRWDELLDGFDDLEANCDHLDAYWFPHTDRGSVKLNRRAGTDLTAARPLSTLRAWIDDDLLANGVLGAATGIGRRLPGAVPTVNRLLVRGLSDRCYSDVAHRVFTSPRRVRFREMEYAVPRDVGIDVLREVRRAIDASAWRIGFPVEIRTAPADDIALSTASGRDSLYLAFHVPAAVDHRPYFDGIEPILVAAGGRPHWGKLHTLVASDLVERYPRFEEFRALRDRLDPDRVFANDHLRRILGD